MKRKFSIGRADTNDIVINHDTVSRTHAEMTVEEGKMVISDFNIKNGTFIIRNNKPVRINIVEVTTEDTVVFGGYAIKVEELLKIALGRADIFGNRGHIDIRPSIISPVPSNYPFLSQYSKNTEDFEYAGFWVRVGAYLVDLILIIIITWPILIAIYGNEYFLYSKNRFIGLGDFLISWVFPGVATIAFWFYKQATPGKMSLSLRIVDAKTGKSPTLGQCIGRYFAYIVSGIPLGLGFIWIAFDKKKQGWHDKLAGTLVLRYKRKTQVRFD